MYFKIVFFTNMHKLSLTFVKPSKTTRLSPVISQGISNTFCYYYSFYLICLIFTPSYHPWFFPLITPPPPLPLSLILIHTLIFFPLFTNLLFMLIPFLLLSFYLLQPLFPLPITTSFYPILPSTHSSTPSTLYFPLPISYLLLPASLYLFQTSFLPSSSLTTPPHLRSILSVCFIPSSLPVSSIHTNPSSIPVLKSCI